MIDDKTALTPMPEIKRLKKRLDLSSFPSDWRLTAVSIDWQGEPLVLFQDGKPPRPQPDAGIEATVNWMNTPPKRHHLLYWHEGTVSQVSFENPMGVLTTAHIQPFGEGWLLAEARGGFAQICDKSGNTLRTLDLGDASEHLQTTPDGHIWVGYFDEGVYGRGIGSAGLICFDPSGTPVFKYAEFAEQHGLPFIDDCYTLNVVGSAVWLSYYTDFPLVWLRDFKLERVWEGLGANRAIAIRGDRLLVFPVYDKPYLAERNYKTDVGAGYQRRFEKNRTKLFTFLDHDGVPWNNNNAEHAIKAFARLRNSIGGKSSTNGIREYLVLLSISETCRYKGVSFLDFLRSGQTDINSFVGGSWRTDA